MAWTTRAIRRYRVEAVPRSTRQAGGAEDAPGVRIDQRAFEVARSTGWLRNCYRRPSTGLMPGLTAVGSSAVGSLPARGEVDEKAAIPWDLSLGYWTEYGLAA